jgi:hypothetical protein
MTARIGIGVQMIADVAGFGGIGLGVHGGFLFSLALPHGIAGFVQTTLNR